MVIRFRPVDPALKVLRLPIVAIHRFIAITIDSMQVDTMITGDHAVGFIKVSTQFIRRTCLARIVACHSNTAAESSIGVLETTHIITLPAVQGNGDFLELFYGSLGIHIQVGIALFGDGVSGLDLGFGWGHDCSCL